MLYFQIDVFCYIPCLVLNFDSQYQVQCQAWYYKKKKSLSLFLIVVFVCLSLFTLQVIEITSFKLFKQDKNYTMMYANYISNIEAINAILMLSNKLVGKCVSGLVSQKFI